MLIEFFLTLKHFKVPVSLNELMDLIRALKARLIFADMEDFYRLSRLCLVKDEQYFDAFDKAFSAFQQGLELLPLNSLSADIPEEWIRKIIERDLSDEEKAEIKKFESLSDLLKAFEERLREQKERHQGGNKWIGTGGTSAFGAHGYNPQGIRVGGESQHKRAAKVWEKRQYRDLDGEQELGTRNMKVALRRLRKFARTGRPDQLDIDETIRSTARQGGWLDMQWRPQRKNTIKLLMFFDVGGSMDAHIQQCEMLFSAAKSEFKQLEFFYFHNCIYDVVWKNNLRRQQESIQLDEIIRTYSGDYRVIIVGDAAMAPYELDVPGGNVEGWNAQPGRITLENIQTHWKKSVWLNPEQKQVWEFTYTTQAIQKIFVDRMYSLNMDGLEEAMKVLVR
ncbi:MAG: VWA domain-containing protein [Pseudomonadota bacterium]